MSNFSQRCKIILNSSIITEFKTSLLLARPSSHWSIKHLFLVQYLSQLLKEISIAPICIQEIMKINSIYLHFNDHGKNINQPFFKYSPLLQNYYLWKGQLFGLEWGDHVLERTQCNKIKTTLSLKNKSNVIQNIFFWTLHRLKRHGARQRSIRVLAN